MLCSTRANQNCTELLKHIENALNWTVEIARENAAELTIGCLPLPMTG